MHTHACMHTHFLSRLKPKQPNIPWVDAKKKDITELTIATTREQIQKVKTTDLKSLAKGFRASFAHTSRQETGCRRPRALLIFPQMGFVLRNGQIQLTTQLAQCNLPNPVSLMLQTPGADKFMPLKLKSLNTHVLHRRNQRQSLPLEFHSKKKKF